MAENMSKTKRNKCNILGLSAAFEDYLLEETTTIWNGAKKCNFYKALSLLVAIPMWFVIGTVLCCLPRAMHTKSLRCLVADN